MPTRFYTNLSVIFNAVSQIYNISNVNASTLKNFQIAYHDVTAGAGLMGPIGEGRPLLSVADLESRLVFTRCKVS